jgi:hypothetical protein
MKANDSSCNLPFQYDGSAGPSTQARAYCALGGASKCGRSGLDLLRAHAAEFVKSDGDLDAYLARRFIGHCNPLGNHFCAFAMKAPLVKMQDRPPPAYTGLPER